MNMNSWTFNEAVYAVPSLSFLHFAFWKVKTCIIIANFIFKWDTRLNLCHIFMNHLYFVFLELHLYVLYSTFNWVLGLILSIPWNALCVCVCVCVCVLSRVQFFVKFWTVCSSVHGILQARILEWVAISSSRGSSQPRCQAWISCIASGFFTTESLGKPRMLWCI